MSSTSPVGGTSGRQRRFSPPIAGAAQETGWEALDKWVQSPGSGSAPAPASGGKTTGWEALSVWVSDEPAGPQEPTGMSAAASTGKTGWEALGKWVSDQPTHEEPAGMASPSTTGWEALDKWVSSDASANGGEAGASAPAEPEPVASAAPEASAAKQEGGFMGFLKRIFGG